MHEIDKKTIEATKRCQSNFSCISDDGHQLCQVEECINDKVIFVCKDHADYCPYMLSFGDGFTCTCPTRLEIYKRSKI